MHARTHARTHTCTHASTHTHMTCTLSFLLALKLFSPAMVPCLWMVEATRSLCWREREQAHEGLAGWIRLHHIMRQRPALLHHLVTNSAIPLITNSSSTYIPPPPHPPSPHSDPGMLECLFSCHALAIVLLQQLCDEVLSFICDRVPFR